MNAEHLTSNVERSTNKAQFEVVGGGLLVRAPVPPEFLYALAKRDCARFCKNSNDGGIYAKLNIFSFASRKIKE